MVHTESTSRLAKILEAAWVEATGVDDLRSRIQEDQGRTTADKNITVTSTVGAG